MSKFTTNQQKAIRHIQARSWRDEEFRELIGITGGDGFSFYDVVTSGFWSNDDFERIGKALFENKDTLLINSLQRQFREQSGQKQKAKTCRKKKLIDQFTHKAKALNSRDGFRGRTVRNAPEE